LSGALSYGEGARLYNLKEVADFIHVMGGGYITEDDGTPLLEIKERDFVFCNDMRYMFLRFLYVFLPKFFKSIDKIKPGWYNISA